MPAPLESPSRVRLLVKSKSLLRGHQKSKKYLWKRHIDGTLSIHTPHFKSSDSKALGKYPMNTFLSYVSLASIPCFSNASLHQSRLRAVPYSLCPSPHCGVQKGPKRASPTHFPFFYFFFTTARSIPFPTHYSLVCSCKRKRKNNTHSST